jgi:hypothetical protein
MSNNNNNNNNNGPNGVFDPSSSANLTASALLAVAVLCTACSAFAFGKFRSDKSRFEYQMALWFVVGGVSLIGLGMYIAWAFD